MNELASPAAHGQDPEIDASAEDRAAMITQLRDAVLEKLNYSVGKDRNTASERDWFIAVALATRDQIVNDWMRSVREAYRENRRRVYYLSLEFLIGRLLIDSLTNLGLIEPMRAALAGLGVDLDKLRDVEPDAALGNGGLGRLAACFMESMATLVDRRPRLWHPLRPRPVPPDHQGRLAA